MCDYSLHGIPNRLAAEGDELVVHRFETGTVGLCAARDLEPVAKPSRGFWGWVRSMIEAPRMRPVCAVCIPPGAELILRGVPKNLQREWGVEENAVVHFTQISALANMHRDAIRLPGGREILLQRIREGLRVDVACLGGEAVEIPAERDVAQASV